MAHSEKYDLIVIGGGPAGYAAAIRAGQPGVAVSSKSAPGVLVELGLHPVQGTAQEC